MNLRGRVERLCQARREKTTMEPMVVAQLLNRQWLACVRGDWVEWSPNQELPPWCKVYRGIDPRLVA